jgi:hypothetical protein
MKNLGTRFVPYIGWLFLGIYLVLGITGLVLWSIIETSFYSQAPPTLPEILIVVALAVWAFVGALLISRMPKNPIGWLFSIFSICIVMDDFVFGYAYYGSIFQPGSLPGVEVMMVWLYWTTQPFGAFSLALLFALFPTGRTLSPVWARLIWISGGAVIVYVLAAAIAPYPLISTPFPSDLLGMDGFNQEFFDPVAIIAYSIFMLGIFASISSLFVRLSRSKGVERQQIKWFVFASAFFIPGLTLFSLGFYMETPIAPLLFIGGVLITLVSFFGIPIAATIAILRYRLWDIDIIIRRTLVYGLLTVALALIYFITVIVLQQIVQRFTDQESPLIIVLSTLVIAALFSPLRKRIQEFIDRRFYRKHYDTAETLAQFATKVRDEVDLEPLVDDLLQVVDSTMNPESLSLWLKED